MIDDPAPNQIESASGALFGDPPQKAATSGAYRVLARKYRPSRFEDLIGQEPMVRTLSNAFMLGRIHQAYMLTGVRGVGKTTTARILARAFNYEVPARDGHPAIDKPTVHMDEIGVHCQAIMESRHVDVIEMDAASHTSIDDIREIVDSARYKPVMARTKVYIIDEVHMLSKSAFNGLLKTLEEPPEHVKFLFATTEIEKVPVTVRSRCLRFDLRRVETDALIRHLDMICDKERVEIEHDSLALIARASEGSVRDALSLLDQAIAHGAGAPIGVENLRLMLGLADRARVIDLFDALMKGEIAAALENLKEQYDAGADPAQVLVDLAHFVHFVTKTKVAPNVADPAATQAERERGAFFAQDLSMSVLSRAWQILVKGVEEVKDSPRPLPAADMVLVRLAYAADLPTPEDALKRFFDAQRGGPASGLSRPPPSVPASGPSLGAGAAARSVPRLAAQTAPSPAPAPEGPPTVILKTFADLVALAGEKRDIQIKAALERDVRLVRFEPGVLEFALAEGGAPGLAAQLTRKLQDWTGQRWMVALSSAAGAPSLMEQAEAAENEKRIGLQAHPFVRAALEQFPGAMIVAVRGGEAETPPPTEAPEAVLDDVAYIDDSEEEDF
ncbi:DNA polymerase III subunit gamma/tau [Rhodoblastus acidophilus]|uniref:DNA polymerase III subunit gamma/tau n=1 Tax=Candidatus Rhodoblastus alkanivorans TaxID=2954117 RepID=A0ABS9Z2P3_9HYPH|nr:DNA polymerase III subunit gamma/tau [Candidatus Rhodoblastus alkanivorans]MCI4677523.1 DNA polymerase III subunit gamma/tau [Candidatus Rhodoblastus alkanivorans]MCI4681882.1 DNA polymerase III subunit gamma/tau [Candidatus Rhodoblastus alkanivorans]MDI4642932.1 DNA polymerase III subunit gamma/tau [Rhodoblastus acidophilus]